MHDVHLGIRGLVDPQTPYEAVFKKKKLPDAPVIST